MSGLKEIQCELPQKPWKDYSSDEIRQYCFMNLKYTDCSFVGENQEDTQTGEVYKSFKWILCDMSPVLKEILNNKENRAKNCKEIVVSNPKHMKAILFYGHFKVVDTEIINLVEFYEASKHYQVKILEDEVIKMFDSVENQRNQDWFKLFWLSYVKYPEDQQMRAVFEKVKGHLPLYVVVAEANLDLILEFNAKVFNIFFDIMVKNNLHSRFKITEAYLIKHSFHGNKNKKLEEIDPLESNFIEWYMYRMNLGNLDWDAYKNGPLASNLLTTKRKIEHLEIIKETYKRTWRDPAYCKTIPDEIQSYIQKLREADSNIKTENKQ